ncbi:GNAT family acetyltransferase [Heyndrickxia shackletonii]|uniref:GNAT family acetyltransferase n=1 Tax=Heyndrickxia shackletonii TaxID=157838 RepID=A0A0Q3WSD8_9BACI|nr:GNAT family N-acetyltransferase [Heyndrickxia shackletonii]KQL51036.1 GNAT family acetyltransferase [Heyndrickxia shackletonii]NEZ02047.1 N-acetyltransferase [Heyndrickxia shackletonii]
MLHIRDAAVTDLAAMLEIYNEAIRNLSATFDLVEQTIEQRMVWYKEHSGKYPFIVAEMDGKVVGYSCLSKFRDKEAYSQTTELSIYLSSDCRGKGVGSVLMQEILIRAAKDGYHTIISGITGGNEASVKLHEKFGFEFVGCFKEVGYKFNEWQDVHFYQLIL